MRHRRFITATVLAVSLLFTVTGTLSAQRKSAKTSNRLETCRAKLKKAQALDVLYDLRWDDPRQEPRVVIGPTFLQIPFDAKEGLTETVNCFLVAGDANKYVNFNLIEWRNGTVIGRWEYGRLTMRAR